MRIVKRLCWHIFNSKKGESMKKLTLMSLIAVVLLMATNQASAVWAKFTNNTRVDAKVVVSGGSHNEPEATYFVRAGDAIEFQRDCTKNVTVYELRPRLIRTESLSDQNCHSNWGLSISGDPESGVIANFDAGWKNS